MNNNMQKRVVILWLLHSSIIICLSSDCHFVFESDKLTNGTFYSPNYPNSYPADVFCKYTFRGRGKERVQIIFSDFDLYKPADASKNCDGADVLMIFITINGQKERLDNLCGDNLPKQLMSNGPSMSIEFKSSHNSSSRGFQAEYRFVTNFGITSGIQDPQSVCGFIYRSWENYNGTFTSPNHPGLYPRDNECHYFFYGNRSEKVLIKFTYFDVEGVSACGGETASDYVEFSNYQTVDRKMYRHCGNKKPSNVESDGDYFRITFKSNDKLDATGFEAFYQFKKPEETFSVVQIRGNASSSSTNYPTDGNFLIVMLIVVNLISAQT